MSDDQGDKTACHQLSAYEHTSSTSPYTSMNSTSTSPTAPTPNAYTTTWSSVVKNAISSTAGAAVTATVVTPLDVVKVRLQAHVCPSGGPLTCQDPHCVTTSSQALRHIVQYDGVRGLWKGLNITLLLAIPTTGFYFTLYEVFKQHYTRVQHQHRVRNKLSTNNNGASDWVKNSVCGASARILAATIASPLELARTNIQAASNGSSVISVLRQVRASHGISGWWSGLGPTLIRDAPFSAVYWSVYEGLKSPLRSSFQYLLNSPPESAASSKNKFQTVDVATYLTSGVAAGALAALVTIPADVVKTRKQTGSPNSMSKNVINNSSSRQILKDIIRHEGVRGLFKGTGPRVAKVAPACAIMMGSFEMFKNFLGD